MKEFGLDLDLDLPASPNSTSSSTTLLNEEIIHATRAPEQQCPLVIPNNNAGGENVEPQREGSLSEESGVYTQSTDSRIRLYGEHAHSGSSMSLNHLVPQPHRAASPNIHIDPHIDPPVEGFGDHDFLPSNGHLQVTKEASLGDSSSQATVMTEIDTETSHYPLTVLDPDTVQTNTTDQRPEIVHMNLISPDLLMYTAHLRSINPDLLM